MTAGVEKRITNNVGGEKLFNFRPCLFVVLFLSLGILVAKFFLEYGVSAWCILLAVLFPTVLFAYFKTKQSFFVGLALIFCFLVGFSSYSLKANDFRNTTYYNSFDSTVYGRVVKSTENGEQTRLTLSGVSIDGQPEKGRLIAYLPTWVCESVREADFVFIRGAVKTKTELFGKNATFDEYFADDIRFFVEAEKLSVVDRKFDAFALMRETLKNRLYAGMGADSASVSFAVLTGDSSGIEDGLLDNVRRGGIAHIFAVSGLHIGTLYAVCIFLLDKLKRLQDKKLLRFITVGMALLFYGGFCGYSESVLRAVVTCLALYASKLIGVKKDSLESLSFAGALLLLINPVSLFCVGFQLSFSACYGIVILNKPLQVFMERAYRSLTKRTEEYPVTYPIGRRGKVFSFLAVSVSAQLFTAPVLIDAYGYLSAWGLLLNAIFVPCVGLIFSLTLGFSALACLLPSSFAVVILWVPNLFWTLLLLTYQTLDFAVIFETVTLNGLATFCYYAFLIAFSGKFNLKEKEKPAVLCALALSCVCAYIIL